MADVFISYSHDDQPFVRRIASALEAEGCSVWWDHSIPPGQTWDSHIARGIKEAKAAIVVWSQYSVNSDWVKEEASIAREAGKYLPVQIDENPPPIGFSRIQAAQLIGWNGDPRHPQWQMLVGEVRRVMGAGGAAPTPRPTPRYAAAAPEKKRNGVVGLVLALAFVLIAGAAGYFYLNQSRVLHAATPTMASNPQTTTATPRSDEVGAMRGQDTETQAALREQQRLREAEKALPRPASVSTPTNPAQHRDMSGRWFFSLPVPNEPSHGTWGSGRITLYADGTWVGSTSSANGLTDRGTWRATDHEFEMSGTWGGQDRFDGRGTIVSEGLIEGNSHTVHGDAYLNLVRIPDS